MSPSENPCLSLAIKRLEYGRKQDSSLNEEHFAIWVLKAPYPSGYVLHDCICPEILTQAWLAWQQMFSLRGLPHVPFVHNVEKPAIALQPESAGNTAGQIGSLSGRVMQNLGIYLWQWLFDGPIQNSLNQSQGIAIGQTKPLRLRLEIRDPDLIELPWEIMQPQAGKQAISLSQQLLFSRTTSDVDPLPVQRLEQALNILLVLGHDAEPKTDKVSAGLQLQQEASVLTKILQNRGQPSVGTTLSNVDTLLQPTPAELIERLETGAYNVLFYAGHGVPAPDGGLLFLQPNTTFNGTELAQVLVRCRVKLAVFNACWGAQPERQNIKSSEGDSTLTLHRSSLAEVLIHHGVPAVLGMRDSIADQEALTFIQAFAQALYQRMPIDEAVAVARQQLLMLYKFNQPAWTLPVLYMHPEFDGELIRPLPVEDTQIPEGSLQPGMGRGRSASLRLIGTTAKVWQIRGGIMRVGSHQENDLVLQDPGVSRKHAEIFCRDSLRDTDAKPDYFLRDDSRFGTLISVTNGWQKVHRREVALQSGVQLKFGSNQGQTFEFVMEGDS